MKMCLNNNDFYQFDVGHLIYFCFVLCVVFYFVLMTGWTVIWTWKVFLHQSLDPVLSTGFTPVLCWYGFYIVRVCGRNELISYSIHFFSSFILFRKIWSWIWFPNMNFICFFLFVFFYNFDIGYVASKKWMQS